MAAVGPDVVRDIELTMSRMRSSLDPTGPFQFGTRTHPDDLKYAYLRFESVRVEARLELGRRYRPAADLDSAIQRLIERLRDLLSDKRFSATAEKCEFRPTTNRTAGEFILSRMLLSRGLDVKNAIQILSESLAIIPFKQPVLDLPNRDSSSEVATMLRRVVPATQDVGPVQFEIDENGKIKIRSQRSGALTRDAGSISAARAEILESGNRIIENLRHSNCDRRIIEGIELLQNRLEKDVDIVRLGLSNISCEVLYNTCKDELSPAVSAMVEAHTVSISMFVGQFPEWQRFSDQAAAASLSIENIETLQVAVDVVLQEFSNHPEIADPEVPKTFKFLREIIGNPRGATKRALFAVWRTLENFMQKVFQFSADFFKQTADKTSKKLSDALSSAIVVTLMTAALAGALALESLSTSVQYGGWIKQAVEVVKRQIEAVK